MTTLSEAPGSVSPSQVEQPQEVEAQIFIAPQWKLVWWKFRKHKVALFCGIVLILIYRPRGCAFHPRCDYFMPELCDQQDPPLRELADGSMARCLLYGENHG